MKTWIKGGLWGAGILFVIGLMGIVFLMIYLVKTIMLQFVPSAVNEFFNFGALYGQIIWGLTISLVVGFIIGSVIGYFKSRTKNKK